MADIKEIKSLEEYNEFVGGEDTLNVLKVSASWCAPCRVLFEKMKTLTPEDVDGVLLAEVNAEAEWFEDKADELNIRGLPTVIAFSGGKEIDRASGLMTRDMLIKFFEKNK